MSKKTLVVVQCRLKSERLPAKALLPLGRSTVLGQIVRRCQSRHWKVVVACPKEDVEPVFNATGITAYGGPEEDILTRIMIPVRELKADYVIRCTGDNPLVDPAMLQDFWKNGQLEHTPIITNTKPPRTWPNGYDLELYQRGFLEELDRTLEGKDREYFYSWCLANCGDHAFTNIMSNDNASRIRLTLDHPEDYELIQKIYDAQGSEIWTIREVLSWLYQPRNRHLLKLNAAHNHDFGDRP